ncbi:MAG: hypothetical protein K2Z81_02535, partial [Cyanobacteria bacterium]|nr:hypothetical protein [Cyanobacteriota bacterium]
MSGEARRDVLPAPTTTDVIDDNDDDDEFEQSPLTREYVAQVGGPGGQDQPAPPARDQQAPPADQQRPPVADQPATPPPVPTLQRPAPTLQRTGDQQRPVTASDTPPPPAATPRPGDQPAQAGDRQAARGGDAPAAQPRVSDPYEHMAAAQQASERLDVLLQQNRPPTERIVVRENGQTTEMTVAERVRQLKDTIITEIAEVHRVVDDRQVQQRLSTIFNDNTRAITDGARALGLDGTRVLGPQGYEVLRDEYNRVNPNIVRLSRDLGLNVADVTGENGAEVLRNALARETDNGRRTQITELTQAVDRQKQILALKDNLDMRGDIQRLRRAPEFIRLLEAEYTAKGYLNVNIGP